MPGLVSWRLRVELVPTRIEPKSSEAGDTVIMAGAVVPISEMNSSGVEALEEISIAPMRVDRPEGLYGVKVTVTVQAAPGARVEHAFASVKSDVDWIAERVRLALPVLERVMVCGDEVAPTDGAEKVSEFCEVARIDSTAAFDGEAATIGVEAPVRLIKSGLEAASLSMMRETVSVEVGGGLMAATT